MRLQGKQGRKGLARAFTLIEVLVAGAILGTISMAYYGALSSGFILVQSTREDLRATQIMMQRMEAIRLCNWRQLRNFTFQESYDPQASSTPTVGTMYYGLVTTNAVSSIGSTSYKPNMRLVTVTLFWVDHNGPRPQTHYRQMETQVARYGMQNYVWGKQ